jgi:hypothetical protein
MARTKKSKRIVVDASVARASGGANTLGTGSKNCRDVLDMILKVCHQLVMTPAIREEWNKHQSSFATGWRRNMVSKRKMIFIELEEDAELREKIVATVSENERKIVLKDCILLEASLASDRIVISLDKRVHKKFTAACADVEEIRDIAWLHPDEAEILTWLQDGAEIKPENQLRNFVSPES